MKKTILVIALAVITNTLSAQVSFGVQAGTNIAFGKITYDNTGLPTVFTNDPKIGFFGGLLSEIPISRKFAFRPEINFIQKGSKTNTTFSIYNDNTKVTLNYIEMPLNVVYKLPVRKGDFFFGLGPSVAFGISGKNVYTNSVTPANNETNNIKFDGKGNNSNYIDNLKAFDFGANVIAGYKFGVGVFFKLDYTYNFLDIDPDDTKGYKNRGLNICIGYMFVGSASVKKK